MFCHNAIVEFQLVIVSMNSERTNIFCDTLWSEIHLPNMQISLMEFDLVLLKLVQMKYKSSQRQLSCNLSCQISGFFCHYQWSLVGGPVRRSTNCVATLHAVGQLHRLFTVLCSVCSCGATFHFWLTIYYCSIYVRNSITGYLSHIDKGYITPADRRSRNIWVLILGQIHLAIYTNTFGNLNKYM